MMETSRPGDGHQETQERQHSILISTFKKGHRPTDSGVSCMTTISMVSEDRVDLEEDGKEVDEREEEEEGEGVTLKHSLPGSVKLGQWGELYDNNFDGVGGQ